MTLYREHPPGAFTPWDGTTRIGGVLYPLHIEQLWPAEELAALNLYVPEAPDALPEDKVVTETKVRRVGGVVKYVNTFEDAPAYVPSTPHTFAMGRFSIGEWEIGAISATMGIAGATKIDTGVYWIDFLEGQPDTDYIAIASDRDKSVAVTERYDWFCVVESSDMAGNPSDPAEFVIQLTRVI